VKTLKYYEQKSCHRKCVNVKDVIGCNWQMCRICINGWFRLGVQEKHKAVQIIAWALGFGTGPSKSELKKIQDTKYPVGALRFCLHAASSEIWGILQRQISHDCNSLSFSSCEDIITPFTERAKMEIQGSLNC
jgi:hypothetical protein